MVPCTSEDVHCLLSEVLWDTRVSFAQILHQYVGPGMRIFDNPPGHRYVDQAMQVVFKEIKNNGDCQKFSDKGFFNFQDFLALFRNPKNSSV